VSIGFRVLVATPLPELFEGGAVVRDVMASQVPLVLHYLLADGALDLAAVDVHVLDVLKTNKTLHFDLFISPKHLHTRTMLIQSQKPNWLVHGDIIILNVNLITSRRLLAARGTRLKL
jgi:hypothetical protein